MKGKKIQGKRISLIPVKISDAPLLNKYYNQVYPLLGQAKRNTLKETKEFIKGENAKKSTYYWGIQLNESHITIGAISLNTVSKNIGISGSMIGEDYTNLGYGTEAKHLVLDFSFNHSSFIKILSYVYSYNERSRAYSFKCGYIQEAMMSGVKFHNEKYWDEWILSITKKQWIPVWENYKKKHE